MIDLAKLAVAAQAPDGAHVSQSWLKQALAELTAGRAAAKRPRCFGLKPDLGL